MTKIWFPVGLRRSADSTEVKSLLCLCLECILRSHFVEGQPSAQLLVRARAMGNKPRKMFERLLKRKEMNEALFSVFRSLWREANFSQLDVGGLIRLSAPAASLIGSISSLTRIEARSCPGIDDSTLSLWAQSLATSLEHLDISSCRKVSDKGIAIVLNGLKKLRELIASDLPLLTDASCRTLASSAIAETLEVLDWSRSRLTDKGIAELVVIVYPEDSQESDDDILLLGEPEEQVDTNKNDCEEEEEDEVEDSKEADDCQELVSSNGENCSYQSLLPALVTLKIAGNTRITNASARTLIEAFPSLRTIDVSATRVSATAFGLIVSRMESRFPHLTNKHLGPGCQFSMPLSNLLLLGASLPVRARSNWNSVLFTDFLSEYGWRKPGFREAPPKQPPLPLSSSAHRVYATITAYLGDVQKEKGQQSLHVDVGEQEDEDEDQIVPAKTRRVRKPMRLDLSSISALLDDSASDDDDDDCKDEHINEVTAVKALLKTNPTKRLRIM